jgi:hypothetical protein
MWCVLAAIVVAGVAARAWIHWAGLLPPGVDAGYYVLQARGLIEDGKLAYADVPLYFWLTAAIAKVMMLAGLSLDRACLIAPSILDCVAAPLGAVVLFAIGAEVRSSLGMSRWRGSWSDIAAASCAALIATLSYTSMRMVSDFEKQAMALSMVLAGLWLLGRALDRGSWQRWAACVGVFLLAGLTHVGTFAAGGAAAALVIGCRAFLFGKMSGKLRILLPLAGAVAGALLMLVVYEANPRKAQSMLTGMTKLFAIPSLSTGGRRAGGPPGGGGGGSLPLIGVAYAVGIAVLWGMWRRRNALRPSVASLGAGCTLAAMFLCCPLLAGEYFHRLSLMSPVMFAAGLAVLLSARAAEAKWSWPAWGLGAVACLSGLAALGQPGRGEYTTDSIAELKSIATKIDDPARTVIFARHGMEFWACYYLRTPVRQIPLQAGSLDKFTTKFMLTQVGGGMGPRRGMGPGGGGRMGPPDGMRGGGPPPDGDFGPPGGPPEGDDFGPPGMGPPGGFDSGDRPRGRGGEGRMGGAGPMGGGGPMGGSSDGRRLVQGEAVFTGKYYKLTAVTVEQEEAGAPGQ